MASDEQSLRALEALMTEFFHGSTTNERKREIENILNNFGQQNDSWQHCLYYLTKTNNEYVLMYCCSIIETLINKKWVGFPSENKATIRPTVMKFLLSEHQKVPHSIRNKICKLIVDIGRLDWPHFYPDFLTNIMHMVQQNDTMVLGLKLLQTASEELACPRDDISTARKEELHHLLLAHIPNILSILGGILEVTLEKSRHFVTATPPPSPTYCGDEHNTTKSQQTLFSTSPLHQGSLLSSMFKSLNEKGIFKRCPEILTKECYEICSSTLTCLSHFFSWIPLSDYITPSLVTTVFQFASFGCHPSCKSGSNYDGTRNDVVNSHASIGILAMGCINEIMSKNCVPTEFEDFLLQMFQYTFHLLQCLTKDHQPSQNNHSLNQFNENVRHGKAAHILAELNESYIEKFTEFLRLFVGVHFRRFEASNQFPVLEFLALLFKYTFQQPNFEGFYNCLDIWAVFIDYLVNEFKRSSVNSSFTIEKYKDALTSLVVQITHKFLFKYNSSQLEELDDETFDDDCETEWQSFLRQCVETIAHVAELLPSEIFGIIDPIFEENSCHIFSMEAVLHSISVNCGKFDQVSENECRRLHCLLRDLSSILQTMGRLSHHFISENFTKRFDVGRLIVKRLCNTVIFLEKIQKIYCENGAPAFLKIDLIEVHAQALASLKAYVHWVSQYYAESMQQNQLKDDVFSLLTSIIESSITVISKNIPEKICHSAAHLLMSISSTIRSSLLTNLNSIQTLFNLEKYHNINFETQLLVFRSISNILLLPWPNSVDSEQQWENRFITYSNFIKSITSIFGKLQGATGFTDDKQAQENAKPEIKLTLKILRDIVDNHSDSTTKTKQLLYQSIQEPVNVILHLFSIYINCHDVLEEMLSFFLVLFDVLRVQIGVQFTERIITTFMDIFTSEQLTKSFLQENSSGIKVIEKFLNILQFINQEPGSSFRVFLPSTIKLCMFQIYPIIAQRPSPDVKVPLFELLKSILLYNWRYFFKSNILSTLGHPGNDVLNNQDQFISIMQAFGQSFLQPDINIFKQNLAALDVLNTKWKLYHKTIFKEVMLHQFLKVLIQTLIHKTHDLLQEEIGISIYNMASVDFEGFYNSFIPEILKECSEINEDQRQNLAKNMQIKTDLPTFMKNFHKFVSDLRYYELCNRSLPAGTVCF